MAITVTLAGGGNSDTDTTSYTTGTVSFTSGRLYVIGTRVSRGGSSPTNPAISGTTSGTWTNIVGVTFNTVAAARTRVQAKYFKATSTFSETLTISDASSYSGCAWIVAEVDGYDSSATMPVQAATTNGDAGTSGTISLAAFAGSGNLSLGFFGCDLGTSPFTAGGSFSMLNQRSGSAPTESLCCVYFVGDADPNVTMSSADYGGVGIEVAELVTAAGQPYSKRAGGIPAMNLRPNLLGPRLW